MSDLILGHDWLCQVHHLPGQPFGRGSARRSTIAGVLERRARTTPAAPFLTELGHGLAPQTLSYGQADRAVQQRAMLLQRWGLARGERVGVLGENSIHFVLAVLAVLEAGGVVVLLNQHDPPARVATQAAFTQTRFLLHSAACSAAAEACASVERACSFEDLARRVASLDCAEAPGADGVPRPTDAALIMFTSGTTGAAKAVVQSHYNVAHHAATVAAHHRIGPGVRLLCVLPLHHVNGLEFTIFSVILGGGHTVLAHGFDGLRFWPIVREHAIHIVSLVPNLLRLLAERPRPRDDTSTLRYAVSAAAPLSIDLAARVRERLDLRIVQGYGLSEVTNFTCLMPVVLPEQEYRCWMLDGRRTSIGPPLPGQEVEIHDGHCVAPTGVEGEIVIRGHCVMSGYLHNPAATEDAFRGGWFHTGDLGYYLPDGRGRRFIHVTGRIREIAKRSGALVSLLELDEALASVPGVADAGAAAFANSWVDEEIAALVVKEPGSALDKAAILEHCRRLLPWSALPKVIEFVDEIPRTPSGKIRRGEIGQRFACLRERLFVERRPRAEVE